MLNTSFICLPRFSCASYIYPNFTFVCLLEPINRNLTKFQIASSQLSRRSQFQSNLLKTTRKSRETNKGANKAFCVVVIIPPLLPLYLSWGSSSSVFPSLVGEMLSWDKKKPDVISNSPHSASLSRTSPPYLESWYSKTRSPIISTRRNNSDLKFCRIYRMCSKFSKVPANLLVDKA